VIERLVLGGAYAPSVERRARHVVNPVAPTDANLARGLRLYAAQCAGCHGGLDRRPSSQGQALYPPAPQFLVECGEWHDPEWLTFYEIQHGVRRTGMPAWGRILATDDLWRITSFLHRACRLPAAVQQEWQQSAAR
jgi:mono/diheme cytochrome c family protein